jgi:hypothetical protein
LGESSTGLAASNAAVAEALGEFVTSVRALLVSKAEIPPGMPSISQRAEAEGPLVRELYRVASQYTHGTDAALTLYRKNIGTEAVFGEFIGDSDWVPPLRIAWESAVVSINLVAQSVDIEVARDFPLIHERVLEGLQRLAGRPTEAGS